MTAEEVKVWGHGPLIAGGLTLTVTLVTANGVVKFKVKVITPPTVKVCICDGVVLVKVAPAGPPER
jgi:hypothetical protein